MQATIEIISPAMAKEYLERAMPNRPLMESRIAQYAADMADGLWMNNGQSVIFSDTHELMDGQQRMHAILRSGKPQSAVVVRGVPRQAFVTMDTGRSRSLQDVMAMEGVAYPRFLATAARTTFNYVSGTTSNRVFTFGTLYRFAKNHPYMAEVSTKVGTALAGTKMPRPQLTAILFLANEKRLHDDAVDKFINGLATGANLWTGDPRLTFRDWLALRNADPHRVRGDWGASVLLGALAQAWSAFGQGGTLERIKAPSYWFSQVTSPIYGYDQGLFHDVSPELVQKRSAALTKLRTTLQPARSQAVDRANAAKLAAPTPTPKPTPKPEPDIQVTFKGASDNKAVKAARMRIQAKAMERAANR